MKWNLTYQSGGNNLQGRKAVVSIEYNGKKVDTKLAEYLKSFTYNDIATGQSDSINISLHCTDKKWMGVWFPVKGDSLNVAIRLLNWLELSKEIKFKCGKFTLDEFSFTGRPLCLNIGALSIPIEESFSCTERSKTYKKITMEEIAKEIAKRAKIQLVYDANKIYLNSTEQSSQSDCDFLYRLCEEYGLGMKVYASKLILFDEARYEKKKSVAIIEEKNMLNWSYQTTITKTYTGAKISYKNPMSKKDLTIQIGEGKRILNINESADNKADAEKKAIEKVNTANKKMTTMKITILANPKIVATSNVTIKGLKKLDGKYAVDQVTHSIAGSGYTMSLSLRLIQKRIKGKGVNVFDLNGKVPDDFNLEELNKKSSTGSKYIVKQGDTLWSISKQFYKTSSKWNVLYEANKEVIENTAKKRGKANSSNGHWIWAGTELVIPSEEKEKNESK